MTPLGNAWLFWVRKTDFTKMKQNIFSFQHKNMVTKIFFICLHLHSSSVYTWITLSITEKVMLNIKPMKSLVVTNIIFDRNIGRKKWVTIWIKFEIFSCIKQCPIQKHFLVLFQQYGYPKIAPKKILSTFFPCLFSGKTKWNSLGHS